MSLKPNADELALVSQEIVAEVIRGPGGQVCVGGVGVVAVAVIYVRKWEW